ncbi:UDP-2,3-diacylglucosamine diphosphatase [Robbsia sp. Bb-Pol-6]|uniref:UDP-2,3-diacylglucosamine hydrolase n=1 Tax=Robbsia betulipollinis TaxID=2981849 RepID=A0ABT3ZN48_9BURK|nr:UDP-2,3-diacylglucosamine diphosphatase [Robbsia betulipollinis]MCY0387955.1 UDP-2,3-diacylglucosamine diphosphatase [Robbsia betulipollinis]
MSATPRDAVAPAAPLTRPVAPPGDAARPGEPAAPSAGRATLFLADLHLSPAIPRTVAAFERFIDAIDAHDVGAVYILGDLFEFWIGDDMLRTPFAAAVAARLASLAARGIALRVMHGNRDFLLGRRFARAAAAELIPDPFILDTAGARWILTHGDALCTDDIGYQRFRRFARHRAVQCLFLAWPRRWRMKLAGNMRANSEQAGGSRMHISDVNGDAVAALFARSAATRMIQGHTHRPARHDESHDGRAATRWVLPDWELDTTPPRGGYLRLDDQGLREIAVTFSTIR